MELGENSNLRDVLIEENQNIPSTDQIFPIQNQDISSSESGSDSSREPGTYQKDPWDWLFINKSDNEEETLLYRVEALEDSFFK